MSHLDAAGTNGAGPNGSGPSRISAGGAGEGVRVSALYVYPIKSCAGTALTAAEVGPRGFVGDRALMLVDADGHFLTQRQLSRLALVRPHLDGPTLTLTAPGQPPLTLRPSDDGPRRRVEIWSDRCPGVDQGAAAADWFGTFLGVDCRLVKLPEAATRRVDGRYARRPDDQVGFADGYPFLLLSEASLAALNGRLEQALPMDRFRPNIVVTGCPPYAEDRWRRLRIGPLELDIVKPCARCSITTVDQATAERGAEPLRTLATHRKARGKVYFGQNLLHVGSGQLRVGDAVEVLEAADRGNGALAWLASPSEVAAGQA